MLSFHWKPAQILFDAEAGRRKIAAKELRKEMGELCREEESTTFGTEIGEERG